MSWPRHGAGSPSLVFVFPRLCVCVLCLVHCTVPALMPVLSSLCSPPVVILRAFVDDMTIPWHYPLLPSICRFSPPPSPHITRTIQTHACTHTHTSARVTCSPLSQTRNDSGLTSAHLLRTPNQHGKCQKLPNNRMRLNSECPPHASSGVGLSWGGLPLGSRRKGSREGGGWPRTHPPIRTGPEGGRGGCGFAGGTS